MTRLFDDEPYSLRLMQELDVAIRAQYVAARNDEDAQTLIDNLFGIHAKLGEVVTAQAREMKHFAAEKREAVERAEEAEAKAADLELRLHDTEQALAQADEENARLNARVEELESVAREAARS